MLGVAPDATADAVKKAYRQLARKYHPDVSKEADAAARMSEVNEAYAVLSDPERRAAYDAVGQGRRQGEAFTPPPKISSKMPPKASAKPPPAKPPPMPACGSTPAWPNWS